MANNNKGIPARRTHAEQGPKSNTQPFPGLERWIRRPPIRAAPTTVRAATHGPPGGSDDYTPVVPRAPAPPVAITPAAESTPTSAEFGADLGVARPSGKRSRFPVPGLPSKRTVTASSRNQVRFQLANDSDLRTISGESPPVLNIQSSANGLQPLIATWASPGRTRNLYLRSEVSAFLPDVILSEYDPFRPPSWFLASITTISTIANTKVYPPSLAPFQYEVSVAAAHHNNKLLARAGFELGRILDAHQGSTLGYGCEFRPPDQLRPLLGRHRNFRAIEYLLTYGMSYHSKVELTEAERAEELNDMLIRGNHKSVTAESERVSALLAKDVTHGFSICLPTDTIRLILGAAVQPLGIVAQVSLDEFGNPKSNHRLTQDLTFSIPRPATAIP